METKIPEFREKETIEYKGKEIHVYEVDPESALKILNFIDKLAALEGRADGILISVYRREGNTLIDVLCKCTSLGEEFKNVGGKLLVQIIRAFIRVNRPFLDSLSGIQEEFKEATNPSPIENDESQSEKKAE